MGSSASLPPVVCHRPHCHGEEQSCSSRAPRHSRRRVLGVATVSFAAAAGWALDGPAMVRSSGSQGLVLSRHSLSHRGAHSGKRRAGGPAGCFASRIGRRLAAQAALLDDGGWDDVDESTEDILKVATSARKKHEYAWKSARANGHQSAFLFETVQSLFPSRFRAEGPGHNGTFVDCTFGRGGHSNEILRYLGADGRLIGFDIDPDAGKAARALEARDSRFRFVSRPFGEIASALKGVEVSGILFDIGVSSPQLDQRNRGFSMNNLDQHATPLDLRMNPDAGVPAVEWLQNVTVEELAWVIRGGWQRDELWADRMAQAIIDHRETVGPYKNMREFCTVAGRTYMSFWAREDDFDHTPAGKDHPAKLLVAAIRAHLNQEASQILRGLAGSFELLPYGGRVVVATFRISEVQDLLQFFHDHEEPDPETASRLKARRLRELYPLLGTELDYAIRMMGDMGISNSERSLNPRTRTGRLFVMEKVPRSARRVKTAPRTARSRFKEPRLQDFPGVYPNYPGLRAAGS